MGTNTEGARFLVPLRTLTEEGGNPQPRGLRVPLARPWAQTIFSQNSVPVLAL